MKKFCSYSADIRNETPTLALSYLMHMVSSRVPLYLLAFFAIVAAPTKFSLKFQVAVTLGFDRFRNRLHAG